MKDELGGQIIKELCKRQQWWRGKSKKHKKYFIKRKIKFQNYKNCLEAAQIEKKKKVNKKKIQLI